MPQFNPEWFASQIFWLTIVFVGLYLLLSKLAIPRIGEVLEERQAKVEDDLRKAEELKRSAEAVLEEYEAAVAKARGEAQAELKKAADKVQADSAKRHADFGAKLNAQTKEAEDRIARAKAEALSELQTVAVEASMAATERLLGKSVTAKDAEKAVAAVQG
ncbi:F0F1 ATP synthase subunit B' [Limibacillus sp. MBR-115]|jgi:F-type H+-transporting ATPase subunit b|uniref:F0F1 ATP synthase subunit B family protein n=1 Tax=Limibacillus sp. MBR-115 TaxID=3156465 RepID=UPI00339580BF